MRVVAPALPCGRLDPSDSLATAFVVLESGTCQVPVVTSSSRHEATPRTIEDDDYMSEVYSYPLHDDERTPKCDEKIMNMRVDIKMKVVPGATDSYVIYPTKLSFGGSVAPPSTPTDAAISKMAPSPDHFSSRDCDVIDNSYDNYSRNKKSTSRNRSAPPVTSQYRSRLSNTSQWIKKRAVAELTSARNLSRRPATSVRPFSERENTEAPRLSNIVLEPAQQGQTSMPDMGSFKGKPPISVIKRPVSIKQPRILTSSKDANAQQPVKAQRQGEHSAGSPENNKVDQYVSELRKTIKMRKPGLNHRRKMTPFAVWAISNTDSASISPDLEKFENETRAQESILDSASLSPTSPHPSKKAEPHAVRKEVIRQISVPEEPGSLRKLSIKGDIPQRVGEGAQMQNPTDSSAITHNAFGRTRTAATESASTTNHNAFPRGRTNLSSAAKRGTKRYARQFVTKSDTPAIHPYLLEKDIIQASNGFLPNFAKSGDNSRTLPYIKLQQSVTDYKTYRQNSAPFVRTLI